MKNNAENGVSALLDERFGPTARRYSAEQLAEALIHEAEVLASVTQDPRWIRRQGIDQFRHDTPSIAKTFELALKIQQAVKADAENTLTAASAQRVSAAEASVKARQAANVDRNNSIFDFAQKDEGGWPQKDPRGLAGKLARKINKDLLPEDRISERQVLKLLKNKRAEYLKQGS